MALVRFKLDGDRLVDVFPLVCALNICSMLGFRRIASHLTEKPFAIKGMLVLRIEQWPPAFIVAPVLPCGHPHDRKGGGLVLAINKYIVEKNRGTGGLSGVAPSYRVLRFIKNSSPSRDNPSGKLPVVIL